MCDGSTKQAIETIHVGHRVATDAGIADSVDGKTDVIDGSATEVDPATWRLVTIESGDWKNDALKPQRWLADDQVIPGRVLRLDEMIDVAEMGAPEGLTGTVSAVASCPELEPGNGRVVLTTVSHLSDYVFDLTLTATTGQTETLGVTGTHRFYDEVSGWTTVDRLTVGEVLRADTGTTTVTAVTVHPSTEQVYNFTVETDHVYYVGDLSTLTHHICETAGTTGQAHHAITNPVLDAIALHPNLAGQIPREVDTLITRGVDQAAHSG
jgi:hypothetical protein